MGKVSEITQQRYQNLLRFLISEAVVINLDPIEIDKYFQLNQSEIDRLYVVAEERFLPEILDIGVYQPYPQQSLRLIAFHDWWFNDEINHRFAARLSLPSEPIFSFPANEKLIIEVVLEKQHLHLEYDQSRNNNREGERPDYRTEIGFVINALNHLLEAIDSPLKIAEIYDDHSDEVLFAVLPKDRVEAFRKGLEEFIVPKIITNRQEEFERKLVSSNR